MIKSIDEAPSSRSSSSYNLARDLESKPQISYGEDGYPSHSVVVPVMAALMLTAFLVSLDRTIIATAVPVITDHFNSLNDVGWYASSYMLTMASFQLLMGRIYKFYNPKWVLLSCITIFELGSLVCGVAPNSITFITGRAIAGLGSSGIFSGAMTIIVYLIPLQKRPAWTGSVGAVFALASIAGPLLGGVFVDKLSWRWCFYINLPIGGLTMIVLAFVLHLPNPQKKVSIRQQIRQLDPWGTSVLMPAVICLLLALQWGGVTYRWSDARMIVLLVLSGMLFCVFVYIQYRQQENATIPPRIIKNRSVAAGAVYACFSGGSMMTLVYFLPIWFQAIKGTSAVHSGIMNLPAVLGTTIASILAGFGTRKIGYYTQFMYLSSTLASIGAGLISTFTITTPHSAWIGYQILWGFGLGLGMQQPSVAAQTVLAKTDVSMGISMPFFFQTLGASIFISVANNIFDNKLTSGLKTIPGLHSDVVSKVGATELRRVVPQQYLQSVLVAYNGALKNAFYVSTTLAAATVIGSLTMEWKSLKKAAAEQQLVAKVPAIESDRTELSDSDAMAGTSPSKDRNGTLSEKRV